MPVQNAEVAERLHEIAEILAIEGENPFRVRAYEKAAATIERLPRPVREMLETGEDLSELPGIGRDLAGKIAEIVQTRTLGLLEELKAKTSPGLLELLQIRGLGPKRVHQLNLELGITTKSELQQAILEKRLEGIRGFGEKRIESILAELGNPVERQTRVLLSTAEDLVGPLELYLRAHPAVDVVTVAGSYRRRKETVGDIDILVTGRDRKGICQYFCSYEDVTQVLAKGTTRASILLRQNLQVDLRVVSKNSYGAALLYFTGSKAHNIAVRKRAQGRKLKINEYGLYRGKHRLAGRTEREVYDAMKLAFIEPELREDMGEIEASEMDSLPNLVRMEDIRGNLHTHTTASDGSGTLEEMVEAARSIGHEYIGITDHSPALAMVKGLNARRLGEQMREIDRLNEQVECIRILRGIEVDILEDGSLDLPDEILKRLDIVFAAVHSALNLSREKQTRRIIRAMDNPYVHAISHPTGRIIGKRRPYELDMEAVLAAAKERNCFLEIDAQPDRLDLNDIYIKMAREMGVKLVISADAHSPGQLGFLRYGVYQARRGWLEKDDVLNARSWEDVKALLSRE